MTRPKTDESIGALLEDASWDYAPDREGWALLRPIQRYFRGFPWAGRAGSHEARVPLTEDDAEHPIDGTDLDQD